MELDYVRQPKLLFLRVELNGLVCDDNVLLRERHLFDRMHELGFEPPHLKGFGINPRTAPKRQGTVSPASGVSNQSSWPIGALHKVNLPGTPFLPLAQTFALELEVGRQ